MFVLNLWSVAITNQYLSFEPSKMSSIYNIYATKYLRNKVYIFGPFKLINANKSSKANALPDSTTENIENVDLKRKKNRKVFVLSS